MKMKQPILFKIVGTAVLLMLLVGASCEHTSRTESKDTSSNNVSANCRLAFYNVENLFDIVDDPKTMDEDFTPDGKLHWTEERYTTKLNRLADVFDAFPGELPAFIGLCEIENKSVLLDLVKENKLRDGHYAVIHNDSPDERGIDVAAIYDSTKVKVEYFNYTTINLPDDKDPFTRDLLYAKVKSNDEVIHLFVNHWPSRGGGQAESEKNRIAVANVLHSLTKKIIDADGDAKIVIMGDFNDYPTDKSIAGVLNAGVEKTNDFFNFMYDDHASKMGSYFYKGEWGALDQFMASKGLKDSTKGWSAGNDDAKIFLNDLVLFQDKEGVKRPNRTYAGDDYKGGYSDHLAIYLDLHWN